MHDSKPVENLAAVTGVSLKLLLSESHRTAQNSGCTRSLDEFLNFSIALVGGV